MHRDRNLYTITIPTKQKYLPSRCLFRGFDAEIIVAYALSNTMERVGRLKKRLTKLFGFWLRVFAVSQQKTIILSNKKDKSANRTAQFNHLRQVAANLYKLQRCPHQLRTLDCRRSIFLFWVFLGLRSSRSFYS